ncbi:DEAD/DEAH box helicase [Curtobacterium poinsettiae]|uniref:DEAD/DEAH box helicase n=1 Tax=Curtobacterium poinsettiae TaxID=159612 RepID=A0ABT3S5L9_9MICO|nr:DEAD/DEAH box helicase [Curtobacterium flaccumfaciens]MBT1610658.1 DEAD/DEAH box helicase [Curtobacterium flaccumfaciens pv. poinsettiae]MCX2850125.1 DEAD/DEAH box helicase [Curtobacterium flaccumfaciens pv. poinsettiae]UXN18315.1 DEAD/DEAH box helicase [Curtobacterium flaccumfaciens pv. poinsettiae]
MTNILDRALHAAGFVDVSRAAEHRLIKDQLASVPTVESHDLRGARRMAAVFELQGLGSEGADAARLFEHAFVLWRVVLEDQHAPVEDLYAAALRLAVTGTLATRVTEVRQALAMVPSADVLIATLDAPASSTLSWRDQVLRDVRLSFILLTRKAGGWSDIGLSLALLGGLRDRQSQLEQTYLNAAEETGAAVADLLGLYHLAQMVTIAGRFLETGDGVAQRVLVQLDRHADRATNAFETAFDMDTATEARLIHQALSASVRHSIWAQLGGLGETFSEFAHQVTRQSSNPLLELWPSQREALEGSFLDPYRRALLVEMPTSAGKSLLAKFAVLQSFSLYPNATIAYIVPTRVLVNQVTDDLRIDLSPLGIVVEQAVPVFELDPSESQLLSAETHVLVTTAEKLDLLIRDNHPATANLSMVIVDEAHNLNDGERGARLELVLATVQRDRPGARYVLLSPFLPNGDQLTRWLGGSRQLDPIKVAWRPNKRVVGALESRRIRYGVNALDIVAVDAAEQSNLPAGERVQLSEVGRKPSSLAAITNLAVQAFEARRGATLAVVYGKNRAAQRAAQIAATRPVTNGSPLRAAVQRFLYEELGPDNTLSRVLQHRVAYHHAGMSLEARRLIERLIRDGEIDVICGTTTLAQGVNFPISNVIVEGRTSGRGGKKYSYAQFWNMAGRAGRGLHSDLGVVAYPVLTDEQRTDWEGFFAGGAEAIASQLAELVIAADSIGERISFPDLYAHPTLSSFLQYLAHAMRVSKATSAADDVEDLLRSSLLFQEVQDRGGDGGRRLIELCRRYLASLAGKEGLVALADGTGFSTPSVGHLQNIVSKESAMFSADSWHPDHLFGADLTGLAERIRLIASIPEITLAPDDTSGPFSAERVADVLRAWVGGASIADLGESFGPTSRNGEDRVAAFASYLYGRLSTNASWGLGALERIALAQAKINVDDDDDLLRHVPSMVYFGVDSREAIWMRMAGLPRSSARAAAHMWDPTVDGTPTSYADLRRWIDERPTAAWAQALAATGSATSAADHQLIWQALTGR